MIDRPTDPDDHSVDHLIKPIPPSHEFRFRIRSLLVLLLGVALVLGFFRLIPRLLFKLIESAQERRKP